MAHWTDYIQGTEKMETEDNRGRILIVFKIEKRKARINHVMPYYNLQVSV